MNKIRKTIAIIIIICGITTAFYPLINSQQYSKSSADVIDDFDKLIKDNSSLGVSDIPGEEFSESKSLIDYDNLYNAMVRYNEDIFRTRSNRLIQSETEYASKCFNLSDFGINNDDMIGYITIPKIDIEIPIYLGANQLNMAKGAAHLSYTSLPIGLKNSNVVISGHRGYWGIPFFLHLNDLVKGDEVYITNFWQRLRYRVKDIKILSSDGTSEIKIEKGKDLVTLLTCHPYLNNTHRLVVVCERENE